MTAGPTPPSDAGGPGREARVLVVDDSAVDRRLAGGLVEEVLRLQVTYAENGRAALAALEREGADAVLTDLQMPELDGLELVQAVRGKHPLVPVILMTAHGSEEIALQALRRGAASYVPKQRLDRDLPEILGRVLAAARAGRYRRRVLESLTYLESEFLLENDGDLLSPLAALLQENLAGTRLCDDMDRIRVGVALEEALANALYHGNLEVSSELKRQDDQAYYQLAEERSREPPYRDRRIHVRARLSPAEAVFVVRDEGGGFDPSALPDPTDPDNLDRPSGRGLLLIRTFMDEVTFNAAGNQITLVKRCRPEREVGV